MALAVDEIYLSMMSPETGEYLTANVYTVDGVFEADGVTPRLLSIGQLVMALCLQRAAALEGKIISSMRDMENTSEALELLTQIETEMLDGNVATKTKKLTYRGEEMTYYKFLTAYMEVDGVTDIINADSEEVITAIEAAMDDKNTFSQKTMIQLQSDTNKRDQSYDMVSNILKSLNTTIIANANNM